MNNLTNIPIPYFQIDRNLIIRKRSRISKQLFPDVTEFTELLDRESVKKAISNLDPSKPTNEFEVVMRTIENPLSLFRISVEWTSNGIGELVCIEQSTIHEQLLKKVERLQDRLQNTNYELLEKKEELEAAMVQIDELSAPYIPLTDVHALVPLFGDLTERKIELIKDRILEQSYEKQQDRIYFDFTGVNEISKEGFRGLERLFKSLSYMSGMESVIIGISPSQALVLNELDLEYKISFVSSLREALNDVIHSK